MFCGTKREHTQDNVCSCRLITFDRHALDNFMCTLFWIELAQIFYAFLVFMVNAF